MAPRDLLQPADAPLLVERYAVYDEFASGGMATVHFARLLGAHGFRRTVAAKRLLPHLTRDPDFALMFVDEARLASRVRHPNVVSTLDVVRTEHELLLVMDYVHGESLAKLLKWASERGERMPSAIACAVAADMLHGLHAAHEAKGERGAALGIVHRDVSPQNVLLGLDGITRIVDFGIAKAAGRAQSTQAGVVKGKLAYMAPEQFNGGEASRASDLFASGIVLWEALAGRRLFVAATHAETIVNVVSTPIVPPSVHEPSISPELDELVMRALSRDPSGRFASAREMAFALERCAPPLRPSELARWVKLIVGHRLDKREAKLEAIERGEETASEAITIARPQPQEIESGTHVRATKVDDAANRTAPLERRSTVGYALLGAALIVVPAAFAWTWLASHREEAAPPAAVAAKPTPVPPEVVVPAATLPVTTQLTPDASAAPVAVKPASKRKKAAANKNCEPPYAIDQAGHVLFKVECM